LQRQSASVSDVYVWVFGVLVFLVILVAFLEVVDEMGDVGKGEYGIGDVFFYVALNIPQMLYEIFPMAVLLGSLIGLGGLAAGSELTAMRAAGISVRRITYSALKTGAVLVVIATLIGEVIAPPAQRFADKMRADRIAAHITLKSGSGFWARDGDAYVNIRHILPNGNLRGVSIYRYNPDRTLRSATLADSAIYHQGGWELFDVAESVFSEGQIHNRHLASRDWQSGLQPNMLDVIVVRPRMLSTLGLYRYIGFMRGNGQDATQYEVALWSKIFTPLTIVAMILLTIPAVFGMMRSTGIGQRIFIGVMVGISFFLLNRMFNNMAVVYGVPPIVATSLPSLLVLGVSLLLSRRLN
jgi:lipopolysaccharide export system permease protein